VDVGDEEEREKVGERGEGGKGESSGTERKEGV
jgi:hypothetical protein